MNDERVKQLLKTWHIEEPSLNLADRIVANATSKPQHIPLILRLQRGMIDAFSEWQAGLVYKLAGLALCAIVGFGIGMNQYEASSVDVSGLAFGVQQGGSLL